MLAALGKSLTAANTAACGASIKVDTNMRIV
jgi:hypothetical protein